MERLSLFHASRRLLAARLSSLAAWASRRTGRGNGGMIGGLIALKIDPTIMQGLSTGRVSTLITGTNGKSTTTRMIAAALATEHHVASNADGDNMDAGIVSALNAQRHALWAVLEVDELHVPHVATAVMPRVLVLLNLSRDQLDRVGEINSIERRLRASLAEHPDTIAIANCDDVLMTSVAYDAMNVIWVAAGSGWRSDSSSCPRTGQPIIRDSDGPGWHSLGSLADGREFRRPEPDWWFDDDFIYGPNSLVFPLKLKLPGNANRGNATQAVAAAVSLGINTKAAIEAVEQVDEVAGRYRTVTHGSHTIRLLLAKNPAGWQEALNMVDPSATGLVIAVNGQVPDGQDLSWLWDVHFEEFESTKVFAAGERGTDLAVRLTYAGVEHSLLHSTLDAIRSCPPGNVEVLANYTAFRDLNRVLDTWHSPLHGRRHNHSGGTAYSPPLDAHRAGFLSSVQGILSFVGNRLMTKLGERKEETHIKQPHLDNLDTETPSQGGLSPDGTSYDGLPRTRPSYDRPSHNRRSQDKPSRKKPGSDSTSEEVME